MSKTSDEVSSYLRQVENSDELLRKMLRELIEHYGPENVRVGTGVFSGEIVVKVPPKEDRDS
jgi:glutamate synthase domain-containing protein 3